MKKEPAVVADEVLTQAHPVSADGKRGASRREVVAPQEFAELLAKPIGFDRCLHAFQGRTVDNVIAAMEAGHPHLTTQKSFYVEISRARDRAEMVTGMADRIMDRVRRRGRGQWVCTPKDFVDLGTRASVDQALSRLVGAGELRRVGRGFYDWPRESEVLKGPAPADLDAVVSALARRDSIRIMPDGMVSANRLGLTNAVPSKATYVTDGASRTLRIDGRTIQLRHAGPKVMSWAGRSAAPVVLALRWLGPHSVGDERVSRTLKRMLPKDVKRDLARHCASLPGWAAVIVRSLSVKQSEAG